MNALKQHYEQRMTTWMKACKEKADIYAADDREDEADHEKIRLNVYDIFLKMFNLSLKKTESKAAFRKMYLDFHQTIPRNWHAARAKAIKDDTIDYYIEDIKIETANQIEAFFKKTWDTHEQS